MLTPSGPRPADRIGYPEQGLLVTALVVIAERGSWLAGEVNSFDDPRSVTGGHGVDGVEDDTVSAKLACQLSKGVDGGTSGVEGRSGSGDSEDGHVGAEADDGAQNGGGAFLFLSHVEAAAAGQEQPSHD